MSFFDEGDEPTRVSRPARPRRPGSGSSTAADGPSGGPPDRRTVLVRQAVALGVGLLLLILIVLGVRGCLDSRKERALKDYNRDVTAVIKDSDGQVGDPFFELMASGQRQADQLRVQVNQLRLAADEDVKRARDFDVPGEMGPAQDNLLLVLNLRATGLRKIADRLPAALGSGQPADQAVNAIAGEMRNFDASDVVYAVRVAPLIKEALDDAGIQGQTISTSQFLDDIAWLSPQTVGGRLTGSGGGTGGGDEVAPGLHGHGLESVAVGDTTLQPGQTNRVAGGGGVAFTVKFANQGDNDERDVRVTVRVRGSGNPITVRKTVAQTKAKSPAEVSVPLGRAPPTGNAATVEVTIAAVPGEENTDNNKQSYTVIFTQ